MVDNIGDFLYEQQSLTPAELEPLVMQMQSFWENKKWHEMTGALIEFFDHDSSAPQRLTIYKTFILKFADRINQLKLVHLALKAATTCQDIQERLSFTEAVAKKVDGENSQDAFVYATVAVARVKLDLGKLDDSRKDLNKAEQILENFDAVETVVHAAFYNANADYYKVKEDYASYYRNALLYLACIEISSLNEAERKERANDLALAALVSTSIYNFGELLLHPILDALDNKDTSWLRNLLIAFNKGDLAEFNALAGNIGKNPLLNTHAKQLREKIYLAALTEAVFRRPPHDRAMSFETIASETKVKPDEIEHLVMKALSLGLLRGTIDQVDKVAHINWVQPKVLDMEQISAMRTRLVDWDTSVNELGNWIEKKGQDVWAA